MFHALVGALTTGGVHVFNEGPAISGILSEASALFTWTMTNLTSIISTVTSNGILLVGLIMSMCGFVVGIFKRLVNVQ